MASPIIGSALFLLILSLIDQSYGQKEMESPAKEAVVQKPVQVNVQRPQPMATQPPSAALKTRVVVVHNNMVPVPIECFQPPDSGTCSKDLARVYYDHETRTCKPFSYTGCGGNANRFQSIKNCYRICHPYRYKIRPKVVNKEKANKGMKVRVLPPKQTQGIDPQMTQMGSGMQGMQGGQMPPMGGGMPQDQMGGGMQQPMGGRPPMMIMGPQTRSGGQMGGPQQYGGSGHMQGQQYGGGQPGYGQQMPMGYNQNSLVHQRYVKTQQGPQSRFNMVGTAGQAPANAGQLSKLS